MLAEALDIAGASVNAIRTCGQEISTRVIGKEFNFRLARVSEHGHIRVRIDGVAPVNPVRSASRLFDLVSAKKG